MVRHYKVKGEKRKKKEENYDQEEEESLDDGSKRVKTEHTPSDTEAAERVVDLLSGIPVVSTNQSTKPGVIFIIERASLEIAKIGNVCFCNDIFLFSSTYCFFDYLYMLAYSLILNCL